MRVRCIASELTPDRVAATRFHAGEWGVTPGREYLVLGLTVFPPSEDPHMPQGVGLKLERDGGTVLTVPLDLFEVIDDRASRYWRVRVLERCVALWPEEFYAEYFFDDLSEGVPEVVATYRRVRRALEEEFAEPETEEDW